MAKKDEPTFDVGAIAGGSSGGSDSGGGGSSSGGGTSSSGSSSSGASQAQANAQKRRLLQAQLRDRRREALRNVRDAFAALDLPIGPFRKTIVRHIRQEIRLRGVGKKGGALGRITGPTTPRMNLLLQDVVDSKKFRQRFPGFDNLTAQGMSVSQAMGAYAQYTSDITQIAKDLGYTGPLGKDEIGALLNGKVDKAEFANRLVIIESIKSNKSTLDAFNQILQSQGKQPLDLTGQMDFLAGTAAKDFYDTYEQAFLQGIGVSSAVAQKLAKALGLPGEVDQDLSALPAALAEFQGEAGQEFKQLGLDETALTLAALKASGKSLGDLDAEAQKNLDTARQQLANRRAMLQSRSGVQPRQGPRGEPLLPAASGVQSL